MAYPHSGEARISYNLVNCTTHRLCQSPGQAGWRPSPEKIKFVLTAAMQRAHGAIFPAHNATLSRTLQQVA